MKKTLFLTAVLLVSGCNSTHETSTNSLTPINLIDDKDAVEKYWVVSKPDYPKYPVNAAREGISGCVDFSFIINSDGKAQNINVLTAVPGPVFIKSATTSLKKYRWKPTQSNTSFQPVMTTLQLNFSTKPVLDVPGCNNNDA